MEAFLRGSLSCHLLCVKPELDGLTVSDPTWVDIGPDFASLLR